MPFKRPQLAFNEVFVLGSGLLLHAEKAAKRVQRVMGGDGSGLWSLAVARMADR